MYLLQQLAILERSKSLQARFARPAVMLLLRSDACARADWHGLRALAQDLRQENIGTMRLARRYPDVFHANVIRSRQAENRIYIAVIAHLDQHPASKAA